MEEESLLNGLELISDKRHPDLVNGSAIQIIASTPYMIVFDTDGISHLHIVWFDHDESV